MNLRRFLRYSLHAIAPAIACLICPTVSAQVAIPDAPIPSLAVVEPVIQPRTAERPHKFWDGENRLLFAVGAALNGADFAVTRSNLQRGGQELNPIVRVFGTSTAGLAANFAGETASFMTVSYFFHKTGHHRLERVTSMVNIGCSAGALAYGMSHRGVRVTARF